MAADAAIALLTEHARTVDAYLSRAIARCCADAPARLREAVEYSLFAGGKRLRPALVLETAKALTSADAGQPSESALAAAGAIELIHTFSLVHDDLPAMDDDDLRRGRPTSHKVFGEAMAILAGDAMTTLAFELIATDAAPGVAGPLTAELARASGPAGMIGGQVMDMAAENTVVSADELRRIHACKTGALITAATRMGAIAASAGNRFVAAAAEYGRNLGLAFQIVDDILDATSTAEQLGKATQKDAARGKNTYPALMGVEEARRAAELHVRRAIDALNDWDAAADGLRALARFVIARPS